MNIDENWTTKNIPDLNRKVIIVTGANSGIGFEAAREFARKGGNTILACRNMEKAKGALKLIKAEIPTAQVEILPLDLTSQASVKQFANQFHEKYERLDVLVNNAGIMMVPYSKTVDGFESHLAANHLGHFTLTGLLNKLLLKTPGSRVVNVSSAAHHIGRMDFDNLMFEAGKGYSPARAYGRSKLANLLFTYELQRWLSSKQAERLAVAAHPGVASTNLTRHLEKRWVVRSMRPLMGRMLQSASMGALPTLRAAVDPEVRGGEYFGPGSIFEYRGYPVKIKSSRVSYNEADARRLWEVSEHLTGVEYL